MVCETYQGLMTDAALGVLDHASEARFRAHLGGCVDCREEFARVQTLARAIDLGVAAFVSAEPSPLLLARMRAQIAAEPAPSPWLFPAWLPLAVGAVAAVAALVLWLRPLAPPVLQPFHPGAEVSLSAPHRLSVPVELMPGSAAVNPARAHFNSRNAKSAARANALPKVLVPPDEWRAAMQFVAALQRDQSRASVLANSLAESREPLETANLKISSLEIAGLEEPKDLPRNGDNR